MSTCLYGMQKNFHKSKPLTESVNFIKYRLVGL
jgi:hypothetical protein